LQRDCNVLEPGFLHMGEGRRHASAAGEAIDETRAAFVSAVCCGDADAAASVYADSATLLAPSAEVMHGRDEIAAFWQAGIDAGISRVELEALLVEHHDGVTYEVGRYALRLESPEGSTVVDRGKYALVHELQPDGSWLRAVETLNPDATSSPS
jgi:ketosteroid isomerase-like protein